MEDGAAAGEGHISVNRSLAPLSVVVFTPDPQAKREATARSQAGLRLAPLPIPVAQELRGSLRIMRQEARARHAALLAQLREVLRQQPLTLWEAPDVATALRQIAVIADETRYVAINKSGVIYNELRPGLLAAGFTIIDTYFDQLTEVPRPLLSHGELPELRGSRREISFRGTLRSLSTPHVARDVVGLLGVAAISARDGTPFFLEHFSNISQLLEQCRTLILLVSLDKVVTDRAAAELQLQGMALFGLDSLLLDLRPRADKGPSRLEETPLEPLVGPRAIHVMLLDNGRSALSDGCHDQLLDCIGCRACLRQCPTYEYFGGPTRRNPKEYLTYVLTGMSTSLDLCTSCGMCLKECPVDIEIPFMIAEHRAQGPMTLQRWVLAHAELSSKLASWMAPLSNWALRQQAVRVLLEKTVGIHRARTMPTFLRDNLPHWFRRHQPLVTGQREVAYFAGCSANYGTPEVGRALVAILERNGLRVSYPAQRCSGMPALANGDWGLLRRNAVFNLRSLQAVVDGGGDIVTTCTSCSLMLKKYYPQLLGERARSVAERVFNIEEYLLNLYRQGRLDTDFRSVPARVSYHVPCHLKAQGKERMTVELLNLIPGVSVSLMRGGCSGMSGTFGMKKQHYETSMAIGAPMFAEIERPEVDIPTTDCPTCQLQMDHGTSKTTLHPLLLLLRAYGLNEGEEGLRQS